MPTKGVTDSDHAERTSLNPVKVVIAGPFGAGKTTFIRSISEITVLSTEKDISDGTGFDDKAQTTVGIDFGRITVGDDLALYLFGTPGQKRFDFMWETASLGMLGFILLVDWARPESAREAVSILEFFRSTTGSAPDAEVPFIVAVNKGTGTDEERTYVARELGITDADAVVSVDALDRESVKDALIAFLEALLEVSERPVAV